MSFRQLDWSVDIQTIEALCLSPYVFVCMEGAQSYQRSRSQVILRGLGTKEFSEVEVELLTVVWLVQVDQDECTVVEQWKYISIVILRYTRQCVDHACLMSSAFLSLRTAPKRLHSRPHDGSSGETLALFARRTGCVASWLLAAGH